MRYLRLYIATMIICIGMFSFANTTDSILTKPNLKVLDIGNSYTNDATALLPLIVKYSGADVSDMCLYKAYRGGASFKNWYDRYYEKDDYKYSISKVLGGINANITTGSEEGYSGKLFREVLENEKWDLIIIHQVSTYAPYYDEWGTSGKGGYLNEFLNLIKELQPQVTIGFLLVHSYWDEYSGNKEKSSYERWKKIADSVRRLSEEYPISFVIPYGTAIENLRSSSLNNEYDLTKDGSHCGLGLARYTAACCYYESLIAPRCGISVIGNLARYDASNATSKYPAVSVTDDNALIAQKAAVSATERWYTCLNPELLGEFFSLFYMVDGVLYKSCEAEYGSKITLEAEPTKEGYTFSGWSEIPDSMPAHDVTVNGSFTVNKYHITYLVDSIEYATIEVEYGTEIIPEAEPSKEGYTFSGWSEIPETMPAGDVTVTGTFIQNFYEVEGVIYVINEEGAELFKGQDDVEDVVIQNPVTIKGKSYVVNVIGESAYLDCQHIRTLTIPDGVHTIMSNAFNGCSGIKKMILGKDIKFIGSKAFANIGKQSVTPEDDCDEMLVVECTTCEIPETAADCFDGMPMETTVLLVDDALVDDFRVTKPWNRFGTIMGIHGYVTGIRSIKNNRLGDALISLDGYVMYNPQKGLKIIKTRQGFRKVFIK